MVRIEIRRENDARRAEVPSPKGPMPETQKVPCPVDKNGRTHVTNSKMFHELEEALQILFTALLYLFPMRFPTLTIIYSFNFVFILLWYSIIFADIPLYLFLGKFGMALDFPDEHRKSGIAEVVMKMIE